ncbi:amidase [Planctomycetota bacterium]|nr:amidase [Planctomycetota bacterium]
MNHYTFKPLPSFTAQHTLFQQGKLKPDWIIDYFNICLQNIHDHEPRVQAFAHLDIDLAQKHLQNSLERYRQSKPLSPIDGMPIGIKDLTITADMPTSFGSTCQPILSHFASLRYDPPFILALKQAGAIILGKTTTSELGLRGLNQTTNPHDPSRAPGSSSTGSAAAVAANMLPISSASQALGSLIRPASYCGTFGYKPTNNAISRLGNYPLTNSLSSTGFIGSTLHDTIITALQTAQRTGPNPGCAYHLKQAPNTLERRRPRRIGVVYPATAWNNTDAHIQTQFKQSIERLESAEIPVSHFLLGDACEMVSGIFEEGYQLASKILTYEATQTLQSFKALPDTCLSDKAEQTIEQGLTISIEDYTRSIQRRDELIEALKLCFQGFDVILSPAATSEAPLITDYPNYASEYQDASSLLHLPAITLPIFQGPNNLPVGLQILSQQYNDQTLIRCSLWLNNFFNPTQ